MRQLDQIAALQATNSPHVLLSYSEQDMESRILGLGVLRCATDGSQHTSSQPGSGLATLRDRVGFTESRDDVWERDRTPSIGAYYPAHEHSLKS